MFVLQVCLKQGNRYTGPHEENIALADSDIFLRNDLLDMVHWNGMVRQSIVLDAPFMSPINIINQNAASGNALGRPCIEAIDCTARIRVDIVLSDSAEVYNC